MVIWAIDLAQILKNWPKWTSYDYSSNLTLNNSKYHFKRISTYGQRSQVFYITNTCIPELFAIIGIIAVIVSSDYWCLSSGVILAIFWINDHQRNPELYYYGTPLRVSCHALHLAVWVFLLLFGSLVNALKIQSKGSDAQKPSRVVNNLNIDPYLRYHDPKYVV